MLLVFSWCWTMLLGTSTFSRRFLSPVCQSIMFSRQHWVPWNSQLTYFSGKAFFPPKWWLMPILRISLLVSFSVSTRQLSILDWILSFVPRYTEQLRFFSFYPQLVHGEGLVFTIPQALVFSLGGWLLQKRALKGHLWNSNFPSLDINWYICLRCQVSVTVLLPVIRVSKQMLFLI